MESGNIKYNIESIISQMKKEIRQCCGISLLCLLVDHPDDGIEVTRLRHLETPASIHAAEFDIFSAPLPSGISSNHSIPELPIPYSDKRTIGEAKKAWLQYLTLEREARCNNDYAKADDYQEQREKYEEYLTTVISKQGNIRNIKSQSHTDYIIVKNNLLRLIKKVRAINPGYADFIKAHLVIGHTCMWRTR